MNKALKIIKKLNLKTIIFNFRYFPLKTAIKLPVLIGSKVFLHKMQGSITFDCPVETAMIRIGYGQVAISDFKRTRSIWDVRGDIVFKGKAFIAHGCKIVVGECGEIVFGADFTTSAEVSIISEKRIVIGNNTGISWKTQVMDTDFHHIADEDNMIINPSADVIIGDKVWVGCNCTILKGAVIPSGSIIAAGSMITKKLIGEKNIFGGSPTRVLKSNITWWY